MIEENIDLELRRLHDQQMRAWFGEVRPLRLEGSGRFFTPPPALPLRAVFVPPALSPSYVQATVGESVLANGADVLQWFEKHRRLVVLGDPGSGKSTLVSWLAWRLCAGLTERLPQWAEGALPVPMILRDMKLDSVNCFDDLLAAYVRTDVIASHPRLHKAWGQHLQGLIAHQPGSLLFLIDGLDELSAGSRDRVRDAIRDGMSQIDQARFMVTSRIVGYEQCAIEAPDKPSPDSADASLSEVLARPATTTGVKASVGNRPALNAQRLYVMPFDNARIRQFARNWFEYGETEERRGDTYLEKFIIGVMRDSVALQLVRTPNLLVMAAQVFGITNTLPDGRAKLYEAITKAYLESIDRRYGLVDQRYSLEQKKAWLAAVGYQMQLRRSQKDEAKIDRERDLLVAEVDVIGWLSDAMRESDLEPDTTYVSNFVDAIARRSGLFIPRGEGQYAFAHLSIQEYFAALHLQNSVRDLALSAPERLQTLFGELAELGSSSAWREALVTFFELPEWSPKVTATLCQAVFGKDLERVPQVAVRSVLWQAPDNSSLVETLARLVVNPGIALPSAMRERGFELAVSFLCSEREGSLETSYSGVLAALTINDEGSRRIWKLLRFKPGLFSGSETMLDLRGARMLDFSPLRDIVDLTSIRLQNTLIGDLSPLSGMAKLVELSLERTLVVSLTPLASLTQLRYLDLSRTPVSDLSGVETLTNLANLYLAGTSVSDLSPLRDLESLRTLHINNTSIVDLTPLVHLKGLTSLSLKGTAVVDFAPLQGLTSLRNLKMSGTGVTDINMLSRLHSLRSLELDNTAVTDISGLSQLYSLESLDLDHTAVDDISALQGLALQHLFLNRTSVHDLRPLTGMSSLRSLMLTDTPVSDLSPLKGMTQLRHLYIRNSAVKDTSPLDELTDLEIAGGPDGHSAKRRTKLKPKAKKN